MMLPKVQDSIATLCVSSALVSANASSTNSTIGSPQCASVEAYNNSNASSTNLIPAVVQESSGAPVSTSSELVESHGSWQIINVIRQSPSTYDESGVQVLENKIYLNVSSSATNTTAIGLILSGCSLIFSLPQDLVDRASSNGDCTSILGGPCVKDVIAQVQRSSASIASNSAIQLQDACTSIMQSLVSIPTSCPTAKTQTDINFSILESHGMSPLPANNIDSYPSILVP